MSGFYISTRERVGRQITNMAFNIDNYVDVPTRLAEALKRYPDLRIQETAAEVVTMPDGSTFYRCTITVWRDAADLIPSIATAAEPYPGKTPYTKNSEFMVGMTSALGRALGYMGFGISKSIASRNEIEARQTGKSPDAQIAPIRREQATSHPKGASQKQIYFIKHTIASPISNKIEFGSQNCYEKIGERSIKDHCIKLKIDRLGNISIV
jgi:hypothetical protein